jgi:hypothetical protein
LKINAGNDTKEVIVAYIMTAEDIARLDAAKGKFVSTAGSCTAEGHEQVAHHCPFASHEGTLIDFEVDSVTNELHSITLKKGDKVTPVCLDVKNSLFVWDVEQMVFVGETNKETLLHIKAE